MADRLGVVPELIVGSTQREPEQHARKRQQLGVLRAGGQRGEQRPVRLARLGHLEQAVGGVRVRRGASQHAAQLLLGLREAAFFRVDLAEHPRHTQIVRVEAPCAEQRHLRLVEAALYVQGRRGVVQGLRGRVRRGGGGMERRGRALRPSPSGQQSAEHALHLGGVRGESRRPLERLGRRRLAP